MHLIQNFQNIFIFILFFNLIFKYATYQNQWFQNIEEQYRKGNVQLYFHRGNKTMVGYTNTAKDKQMYIN